MVPGASPEASRGGRARRGGLIGATAGITGAVIVALAAALVVRLAHDVVTSPGTSAAARPATGAADRAALRLAAGRFERLKDPPYDRSFGGVWVDDDPARPHVVVAVVGRPTSALAAALARARHAGPVTTVPASHTWGELKELTHRLTRDQAALRRLGVELVEWGPEFGEGPGPGPEDPTIPSGVVVVRLHRYTPALASVVLSRYPNVPLYVVPVSASYPVRPDP